MFEVDVPKRCPEDSDGVPDVVRIVVSEGPGAVVADHPVLLAGGLPLGPTIAGTRRTELWQIGVQPEDRAVVVSTTDDRPVARLQAVGGTPCRLTVETATGIQVWGLGQSFEPPPARVDWIGRRRNAADARVRGEFRPYGHGLQDYEGGVVGFLQIPVLMVTGGPQPFALVFDYVYRIEADFRTNPWSFQLGSEVPGNSTYPLRIYVVGGRTPVEVRRRVMDLLGRPPVPPRKAFGLWVSEYGFETWEDVDRVLAGLRGGGFPVDGVVLDLFWFGGIAQEGVDHSEMGRLAWDITDDPNCDDPYFPDPRGRLAAYAADHVGFALIEESYVNTDTDTFDELQGMATDPFVRMGSSILRFTHKWLGQEAAMLDWSNREAADWIHDNRRKPFMVDYGIDVHWTDLGEPELFDKDARYAGLDIDGNGCLRTGHADLANAYNLLWHRSIDKGYDSHDPDRRRLLLTRAATAGIQRYGAAVWSGDTGSRMEVLVAQLHNQAHMCCSGVDFYGSDVGGFRRNAQRSEGHFVELYTQWFANSAWFDVPLRPHVDNSPYYCKRGHERPDTPPRNPVAPFEVGHLPSNRANLLTRYALIPYYYSLAHVAARTGMPMMPPPGIVYPDPPLTGIAHQKLVGPDLMVAVVAGHGEYARRVYLPAGRWYDFHSGAAITSTGQWLSFVPEYRGGVFRLPAFARAGAVLPMMHVDKDTLDSFGHRRDGQPADDLILRVYDGEQSDGPFIVYEDDGRTRPVAPREIPVRQHREGDTVVVTVGGAVGATGLVGARPLRVEFVTTEVVSGVEVNGEALPRLDVESRTRTGWTALPQTRSVHACLPGAEVAREHTFRFAVAGPLPATASVLLVCTSAFTTWGEDVYARFITPLQTTSGPLREVKLDPSVTYPYLYPSPPAEQSNCPIWTLLLDHVEPGQEIRFVLEKRRGADVVHLNPAPLCRPAGSGGYIGEIRGNLY
jgi:alpha-glucosidase (family GH31 glycosyl hydrolase)